MNISLYQRVSGRIEIDYFQFEGMSEITLPHSVSTDFDSLSLVFRPTLIYSSL